MATTTRPRPAFPRSTRLSISSARAASRCWTAARKAGNLYLDTYEKAVDRTTELQLKLAGLTQQEWLKSLIEAQVDVTARADRLVHDDRSQPAQVGLGDIHVW